MSEPAEDPTIYTVITAEHRKVSSLLETLADEADLGRREAVFNELRDALERHARAEEAVFYDVLVRHDEAARRLAREAEAEHAEVRRMLAELDALAVDDPQWGPSIDALAEAVRQHVTVEETTIFDAVQAILDDDQARTLAETFEAIELRVEPEAAA